MLTARLTRQAHGLAERQSGRSSVVEHNLAKVGVEGSNPFARSSFHGSMGRPVDPSDKRPTQSPPRVPAAIGTAATSFSGNSPKPGRVDLEPGQLFVKCFAGRTQHCAGAHDIAAGGFQCFDNHHVLKRAEPFR